MDIAPATAEVYVRRAFAQMLDVAVRVGDDKINQRPFGPSTNAVAGLIFHCCEVAEFWLGHVALGRQSRRLRSTEADFEHTATVAELRQLVDDAQTNMLADIRSLEAGDGQDEGGRQFLPDGNGSDAAVVLHVLEELFQHLGHMEVTADALAP